MLPMPDESTDMVQVGLGAVQFAQNVRRLHRRRTDKTSPQRAADIQMAMDRLREAMDPIRSEIGRFPYGPQTTVAEERRQAIRDCSAAIQSERRKLWKMRGKRDVATAL